MPEIFGPDGRVVMQSVDYDVDNATFALRVRGFQPDRKRRSRRPSKGPR